MQEGPGLLRCVSKSKPVLLGRSEELTDSDVLATSSDHISGGSSRDLLLVIGRALALEVRSTAAGGRGDGLQDSRLGACRDDALIASGGRGSAGSGEDDSSDGLHFGSWLGGWMC